MKKNKIHIIAASLMLLGLNQQANAAWAVFDAANFGQNAILIANTYLTAQAAAATGNKVGQLNETVGGLLKQSIVNVEATGAQMRSALGEQEEAQRMVDRIPKINVCIEASENTANSIRNTAVASAAKTLRGGSTGAPARANKITSTAAALGGVLQNKNTYGTCHEAIGGVAGCPVGPTQQPFEKADTEPRGIKGNVKGLSAPTNNNTATFNSFTFDSNDNGSNGLNVAIKYANDATLYDAPKVAATESLKKNPAYAAMYEAMMTKLNASNETLTDIIKMRRKTDSASLKKTQVFQEWESLSEADYTSMTGNKEKPRQNPSLYEIINFEVSKDYLGDIDVTEIKDTNRRLAVNNYILWHQYKQQENTNILLAHILVQLTTPTSKQAVDAEFNKTMSYK